MSLKKATNGTTGTKKHIFLAKGNLCKTRFGQKKHSNKKKLLQFTFGAFFFSVTAKTLNLLGPHNFWFDHIESCLPKISYQVLPSDLFEGFK